MDPHHEPRPEAMPDARRAERTVSANVGYSIGVDLGTTFVAVAVARHGQTEMATLSSRSYEMPSVVLLREDEAMYSVVGATKLG